MNLKVLKAECLLAVAVTVVSILYKILNGYTMFKRRKEQINYFFQPSCRLIVW